MTAGQKKTVLRTVRITQELDTLLRKDADAENISVNTLISACLAKYVEWDKFASRFGFLTVPRVAIRSLFEVIEAEMVAKLGRDLGGQLNKEVLMFWFKKANLEALLKIFSLYDKYSGFVKVEIAKELDSYTVVCRHELGEKCSIFLKYYFTQAFDTLFGIPLKSEISQREVTFKFRHFLQ